MTRSEARFAASEQQLFDELGLDLRSGFLWPSDPERRIHVLEGGSGRSMLMLHGGNSVAASWAPLIAHLASRYRVIAPDRPGCGLSHRQSYRGVDFRKHAISFVSDVMDGLGLERVTLVGNSMGGFWSLLYALARPDRVERVVLLGEPAGSGPTPPRRFRAAATPYLNRLLFSTVLRPRPDTRLFKGLMAEPARAGEALLACAFAGASLPGANEAWRTMLELVVGTRGPVRLTHSLIPDLSSLQPPVLFAWGDHDFAPIENGRSISRAIPSSTFEVVRDAGHLVWIDQPAEVARLVLPPAREAGAGIPR
jgi:pimeloyl-ACP methyl ester carboxylesterase